MRSASRQTTGLWSAVSEPSSQRYPLRAASRTASKYSSKSIQHAQQLEAHAVDAAPVPQSLQPSNGEQPTVQMEKHGVEIRDRHQISDRLPIHLGEAHQVWIQQGSQLPGEAVEDLLGHGHVFGAGHMRRVVEPQRERRFLLPIPHAELADAHFRAPLSRGQHAVELLGKPGEDAFQLAEIDPPGEVVKALDHAVSLQERRVIRW